MKLQYVCAFLGMCVALNLSGEKVGAQDGVDCHPWRCPCQFYSGPSILQYDQELFPDFIRKLALRAKVLTDKLLERTGKERFGNSSYHTDLLIECLVIKRCLNSHLENNCLMEGLPNFEEIEEWHTYQLINMTFFANHVMPLVARVAVFFDQVKKDENDIHDIRRTLIHDIEKIQSDGIYGILCNLARIKPDSLENTKVNKDVMSAECRYFENVAHLDNRNYMIFYITHRLMHYLSDQVLYARLPEPLLWFPQAARKNLKLTRALREIDVEKRMNNGWNAISKLHDDNMNYQKLPPIQSNL